MDDARTLPARRKLDLETWDRMIEAGILGGEDRVELIDGEMIDMAPIGDNHMGNVNALTRALVMACGERAIVSVQNSVRLDRWNAPQPDFAVFRPRADFYVGGPSPGAAETLLVVEVADSSVRYDRDVKLPLYARMGIAEFWIVDLKRGVVDVHRGPAGDGYGETATYRAGDTLALALAPEIIVRLDLVFG